jgi:hypothetical protein
VTASIVTAISSIAAVGAAVVAVAAASMAPGEASCGEGAAEGENKSSDSWNGAKARIEIFLVNSDTMAGKG